MTGPIVSGLGQVEISAAHAIHPRTVPPSFWVPRGCILAKSLQNRERVGLQSSRQSRMLCQVAETVGPVSKVPGPPPVGVDLDSPYSLTQESIDFYRTHGYVRLKNVFNAATLEYYGDAITRYVKATEHPPLEDDSAYAAAFTQVLNIWEHDLLVREFVFGSKLAKIAADLLEVEGVRLYHDQALYKEAGGGPTPWHADQYYWPLTTDRVVTAWVPLQPVSADMGPLAFAERTHTQDLGAKTMGISAESEKMLDNAISTGGYNIHDAPFDLGEVSFHSGWIVHRANGNSTGRVRRVMTMIYMDKDMIMGEPQHANHHADWERFMPGVQPGQLCSSFRNPILWPK
eukprot:jgi/Botrbrau1/879/Bobra.0167s0004.1